MLCVKCQSLHFQPHPAESDASFFIYVLHESKESFFSSVNQKCHLCCLVRGQLGKVEIPRPECDKLNAFVVLRIRDGDTILRSMTDGDWSEGMTLPIEILSKLGVSSLSGLVQQIPG